MKGGLSLPLLLHNWSGYGASEARCDGDAESPGNWSYAEHVPARIAVVSHRPVHILCRFVHQRQDGTWGPGAGRPDRELAIFLSVLCSSDR